MSLLYSESPPVTEKRRRKKAIPRRRQAKKKQRPEQQTASPQSSPESVRHLYRIPFTPYTPNIDTSPKRRAHVDSPPLPIDTVISGTLRQASHSAHLRDFLAMVPQGHYYERDYRHLAKYLWKEMNRTQQSNVLTAFEERYAMVSREDWAREWKNGMRWAYQHYVFHDTDTDTDFMEKEDAFCKRAGMPKVCWNLYRLR